METLHEIICFLQKELLAKNDLLKFPMKTWTLVLKAITNVKEKSQDQQKLSSLINKQQIQQHHQCPQNNHQNGFKIIPSNSRITIINFKIRDNSRNYKKNEKHNNKMENNNSNNSINCNIKHGSSNIIISNNDSNKNNSKICIVINKKHLCDQSSSKRHC